MTPETTLPNTQSPRWFICTTTSKQKAIKATNAAQEYLKVLMADRNISRKFKIEYRFVKRGEYVLEMVEVLFDEN